MVGLFDKIRQKVTTAAGSQDNSKPSVEIDNKIALGVLLWAVAEADDKFLPEEEKQIKEVLKSYIQINDEDMPIVLNTIEIAAIERIDIQKFTKEVGKRLPYNLKVQIIDDLFKVACADKNLDDNENDVIRKISGLMWIEHKDFIDVKMRVKKTFGIPTAD